MASEADQVILSESIESQDMSIPFSDKKWTYVTDSSSNGGVFNGQLQFDLNTLSSQNQWTDLSEAYIQFPVKLSIASNAAIIDSGVTGAFSAVIKNGFHEFIDSVQITLGGTTVQSSQIFENINTSFKMLTQWSSDEFAKYGSTLGLGLDDYQLMVDGSTTLTGLENVLLDTLSPGHQGISIPIGSNPGAKARAGFLNNSTSSTGAATSILGAANASFIGKAQTQSNSSATVAAGELVYQQFALATVRLKDISDVCSKLPVIKGMKGFIYVNYNAGSVAFSQEKALEPTSVSSSAIYGRCFPAMLAEFTGATASRAYTYRAEVSGVNKSSVLTTAAPTRPEARLYSPYFIASPEVDRALSMTKTIRYHERFVTTLSVAANGNYTGTLTPGVTNPKRVVLFPYLTGSDSATAGLAAFKSNPLLSAFDTVPGTTSPFAALKNLQVTVGCKPMFQSPINMDFESFMDEVAQQGLDGSLVSQTTAAGLLDQRKWNQLYRYYTVDVGRRMGADDGASKAVQVSFTNATNAPMTVVAWILYERELKVDTALGMINQNL